MEGSVQMASVESSLSEVIPIGEHLIGAFSGDAEGPTLIAIGGLHGNEPAGVKALFRAAERLRAYGGQLRGRVYFIAGNTRALNKGTRYVDVDLNRHWTHAGLGIASRRSPANEDVELSEIQALLDHILITARDEVYVLDLHSTSASGRPFATVGDTLRNRSFAQNFHVTILLGIEEQLDGTMLEFLNNLGAVTLGFEGGQHESEEAVANHEALVMMALIHAGIVREPAWTNTYQRRFAGETGGGGGIFEIRYRHAVSSDDEFRMMPGFNNFDPIRSGDVLATDARGPVTTPESGVIMMPLYQKLGEDGFFVARRVRKFWLWLSWMLRKLRVPSFVHLLPGVARDTTDPYSLIVNTRIARWLPLQIFHLLGFRRRRWIGSRLTVSRRRHDTTSPFRR